MARYTGPVCKQCRRENTKLFLKGDKCFSEKCPISKGANVPGQHGARRTKLTPYAVQLREKQKVRRYYGVLEGQFAKYYEMANKKQGITGNNLIQICETRLDNVVARLGFAMSRPEARQLAVHGHFTVNGKKVNIPSLIIKAGDVISVKEASRDSVKFKALAEAAANANAPKWLEVKAEAMTATVLTLPARADVDFDFNEQLIVELYSK
jgi:small subunit ribosomal protein S4